MKKLILTVAAMISVCSANAAGFGIYEASARGNALGGALVGKTGDATAAYYNPANATEMTNVSVSVGISGITPFCDTEVSGVVQPKMDAGWFAIPTFYYTIPLPFDLTFSGGNYCEYGLGTKYGDYWMLAGDTVETTIMQYTFNPNLSYKVTDWWSVAAGLRLSYISFNNRKHPGHGLPIPGHNLTSELDGDDVGLGYNFGTTFKLRDDLSVGFVYRSEIEHKISGDFDMSGAGWPGFGATAVPMYYHLPANAKLTLPQSFTMGVNWDATDDLHLGFVATWTGWSSVDTINFNIPKFGYAEKLNWRDVWRFGFGTEYDINDSFCVRGGYVFDTDPSGIGGTTMLPPGDRHILCSGFGWHITKELRLDVGYSFIIMEGHEREVELKYGGATYAKHHFACRNSFSHIISMGLTYNF